MMEKLQTYHWSVVMNTFLNIFPNFRLYLQTLLNRVSIKQELCIKKQKLINRDQHELLCFDGNGRDDIRLNMREVKMVMDRLGIVDYGCDDNGEWKVQESLGAKEVRELFEEKEPSLEEMKEAFDVFDEDKDGFIDAVELQRVLCSLGLKEGLELEQCTRMIRAIDENGDGLIDFHEFVKSIEKCFC